MFVNRRVGGEFPPNFSAATVKKTVCETAGLGFTSFVSHTGFVTMDILKMLAELRDERGQMDEAILTLERLAAGTRGKRRGRPPKWMSAANAEKAAAVSTPREKPVRSAEVRKRMADAQKKRWAARKAQA